MTPDELTTATTSTVRSPGDSHGVGLSARYRIHGCNFTRFTTVASVSRWRVGVPPYTDVTAKETL